MAKPLGFKMVKQTNSAQVPLQPKQAQIAENRAVAISPDPDDEYSSQNSCKILAREKYVQAWAICKLKAPCE